MTQAPSAEISPRQPPLGAWSRGQALAMAAALVVCSGLRAAWPVVLFALPSFATLVWLGRGAFTPRGSFGLANTVTALRGLLLLLLVAPPSLLEDGRALVLVSAVLLLDLLDGKLARQRAEASLFGAHFDMETDALLVLVLTLRLWQGDGFGAWVLVSGLLRYSYVLWLWLWPGTGREAPRSRLARSAFVLLMLGLSGGLVLRGAWGVASVALGTLLVCASFARSCYFSRLSS